MYIESMTLGQRHTTIRLAANPIMPRRGIDNRGEGWVTIHHGSKLAVKGKAFILTEDNKKIFEVGMTADEVKNLAEQMGFIVTEP
jgi:hypothetical protein